MKKSIIYIAMALLAFMLTQCRKQVYENNVIPSSVGKVFVKVTASQDGAKTEIGLDGNNKLTINWSAEGERLYVVGSKDGYLGYLDEVVYGGDDEDEDEYEDENEDTYSSVGFEGELNDITETQNIHFYYLGKGKGEDDITVNGGVPTFNLDVSQQNGYISDGIEYNDELEGMLILHCEKRNVEPGTTEYGRIIMSSMISLIRFIPVLWSSESSLQCYSESVPSSAVLDMKSGTLSGFVYCNETPITLAMADVSNYYMALIPTAGKQTIALKEEWGEGEDARVVYKHLSPHTIDAGKLYQCNGRALELYKGQPIPEGVFLFEVGHYDYDDLEPKYIQFSPGSLYWDGSDFRFESNQYSFAESWNQSHVSHFYWNNDAAKSYIQDYAGSDGDRLFTNLYNNEDYEDIANPSFSVVNGSETQTGVWRAFTGYEYLYLCDRTMLNYPGQDEYYPYGLYGGGTVYGKRGLILLPNEWDWTRFQNFKYAQYDEYEGRYTYNPTDNIFDNTTNPTWAQMEAAGAVFFPDGGLRQGNVITQDEVRMYYSLYGDRYDEYQDDMGVAGDYIDGNNNSHLQVAKDNAALVRLVKDYTGE